MQAIFNVCLLNEQNFEFRFPTIAYQYNHLIKKAVHCLMCHFLEIGFTKRDHIVNDLDNFLFLHENSFNAYVSKTAYANANKNKTKKCTELPTVEDLRKFIDYLRFSAEKYYQAIDRNGFEMKSWKALGEVLLVQILVFNRRRVYESSEILLSLFNNRQSVEEEQKEVMTPVQKYLANKYTVMQATGKRSRKLFILIDDTQEKHLQVFVKYRHDGGVPISNDFLFANNSKSGHMDAAHLLRKMAKASEASNPKLLTSTYLRKQVATLSQMLNMAKFMGHELSVHTQNYRIPEINLYTTKMARFLTAAVSQGSAEYRNKRIDEIDIHIPEAENLQVIPDDEDDDVDDVALEVLETENMEHSPDELEPSVIENEKQKETQLPQQSTPKKKRYDYSNISPKITSPKSKFARIRRPKRAWSKEEKVVICREFKKYLKKGSKNPPLEYCNKIIEKYPKLFKLRNARSLYACIQYGKIKSNH